MAIMTTEHGKLVSIHFQLVATTEPREPKARPRKVVRKMLRQASSTIFAEERVHAQPSGVIEIGRKHKIRATKVRYNRLLRAIHGRGNEPTLRAFYFRAILQTGIGLKRKGELYFVHNSECLRLRQFR